MTPPATVDMTVTFEGEIYDKCLSRLVEKKSFRVNFSVTVKADGSAEFVFDGNVQDDVPVMGGTGLFGTQTSEDEEVEFTQDTLGLPKEQSMEEASDYRPGTPPEGR